MLRNLLPSGWCPSYQFCQYALFRHVKFFGRPPFAKTPQVQTFFPSSTPCYCPRIDHACSSRGSAKNRQLRFINIMPTTKYRLKLSSYFKFKILKDNCSHLSVHAVILFLKKAINPISFSSKFKPLILWQKSIKRLNCSSAIIKRSLKLFRSIDCILNRLDKLINR